MEELMIQNVLKIFGLGTLTFFIGILITPGVTYFLYKYKLWRKNVRERTFDGSVTPLFSQLHRERETTVPRLGGIIIWFSVTIVATFFWLIDQITGNLIWTKLNFISREQTWLLFATLIGGSLVGLADDIFQIFRTDGYAAGGIRLRHRIAVIAGIGFIVALWFFLKLEKSSIIIPFIGTLELGILYIAFFVLVVLATFSGGVIDGIDGLAGGVLATIFAAYGGIAFFQNQIDIATFAFSIVGALLAFLWFNIPPARFYMSETGIMGLTVALAILAFLTDAVAVLPIIGFPLVISSGSVIIQVLSKKFLHRKIFLIAPIHHHFEAKGWPPYKVTMRFWVIGVVCSIGGMILHLLGS